MPIHNPDYYLTRGYKVRKNLWVEEVLGSGLTACIYRCQDTRFGDIKALKRFNDKPGILTPTIIDRIKTEPTLNIQSNNVVKSEEVFNDTFWNLLMPFVEGPTLRNGLESGQTVELSYATFITMGLAKGAGDIHKAGVISTDLKPENTIITPDSRVVIIDLGCFEYIGQKGELMLGTFPYSPREQIVNEKLEAYTDIYANGIIFAEMLMGKNAFNQVVDKQELALKRGYTRLDISSLHMQYPKAAEIIDHCIDPDPFSRYQNTQDLFNDLSGLYNGFFKQLVFVLSTGKNISVPQGKLTVGRDDISPGNPWISGKHLEIEFDGNQTAVLKDIGRNPVFINDRTRSIPKHKPIILHRNDVIWITDVPLSVNF